MTAQIKQLIFLPPKDTLFTTVFSDCLLERKQDVPELRAMWILHMMGARSSITAMLSSTYFLMILQVSVWFTDSKALP